MRIGIELYKNKPRQIRQLIDALKAEYDKVAATLEMYDLKVADAGIRLGAILVQAGLAEYALPFFREAHIIYVNKLGKKDKKTLYATNFYALCLFQTGHFTHAKRIFIYMHDLHNRLFDTDSALPLNTLYYIAKCSLNLGNHHLAQKLLTRCFYAYFNTRTNAQDLIVTIVSDLLDLLVETKQPHRAMFMARHARRRLYQHFGNTNAASLAILHKYSQMLCNANRYAEASLLLKKLYFLKKQQIKQTHRKIEYAIDALSKSGNDLILRANCELALSDLVARHKQQIEERLIILQHWAHSLHQYGNNQLSAIKFASLYALNARIKGPEDPAQLGILLAWFVVVQKLNHKKRTFELLDTIIKRLLHQASTTELWIGLLDVASAALSDFHENLPDWPQKYYKLAMALNQAIMFADPIDALKICSHVNRFYQRVINLCLQTQQVELVIQFVELKHMRKFTVLRQLKSIQSNLEQSTNRKNIKLMKKVQSIVSGLAFTAVHEKIIKHCYLGHMFEVSHDPSTDNMIDKLRKYLDLLDQLGPMAKQSLLASCSVCYHSPYEYGDVMQKNLKSKDAIVLLFQLQAEQNQHTHALVISRRNIKAIQLPRLDENIASLMQMHIDSRNHHSYLGSTTPVAQMSAVQQLMLECFWQPLNSFLSGINHVSIIANGQLLLLPFERPRKTIHTVDVYPGLVFYRYRNTKPIARPNKHSKLAMHCYDAIDTDAPIVFSNAEAKLIRQYWPGKVVKLLNNKGQLTAKLHHADIAVLIGHGELFSEHTPSVARFNIGKNKWLTLHDVLEQKCWPKVVFASSCLLARISSDSYGEATGFIAALIASGTRYVIASLAPINDFLMPVLSLLFFYHWTCKKRGPTSALDQAKRQLRDGSWDEHLDHDIRQAYLQAMDQSVQHCLKHNEPIKLIQLVKSWRQLASTPRHRIEPANPLEYRLYKNLLDAMQNPSTRRRYLADLANRFIANKHAMNFGPLLDWIRLYKG